MTALKLHGKEESGSTKFWMGLSYFLPQGGAEYDASPTEKVYFVLDAADKAVRCESGDYPADVLMLVVLRLGGYDGPVPAAEEFAAVVAALVSASADTLDRLREERS